MGTRKKTDQTEMKLLSAFAIATQVTAQDAVEEPTSMLWPAQAPWSQRMWCGSQTSLNFAANSTCTVTLNKGSAAWLGAGGAFVTSPGDQSTFYFHTYSDTMDIPFTVFYQMTEDPIESIPFNKWGQPSYPQIWQDECFLKRDQKVNDPASISCVDNGGVVEGLYMMGFTFNNDGSGEQRVQIQNTDGHSAGTTYQLTLNSAAYFSGDDEVAIGAAATDANATVTVTQPNIITVSLIEDYNGELLPVQFEYATALANFEPYQAAWSEVVVV